MTVICTTCGADIDLIEEGPYEACLGELHSMVVTKNGKYLAQCTVNINGTDFRSIIGVVGEKPHENPPLKLFLESVWPAVKGKKVFARVKHRQYQSNVYPQVHVYWDTLELT